LTIRGIDDIVNIMTPPAGRPEIGTPINIRLGDTLLAEVDRQAKDRSVSRAEAIRQLLTVAVISAALPERAEAVAKRLGTATNSERWKEILLYEKWLDRALEDFDRCPPKSECEYETSRASHWVSYLTDLIEIKRQGIRD
jgi:hypothetical protein